MSETWYTVTVRAPHVAEEAVSALLSEVGADGVSVNVEANYSIVTAYYPEFRSTEIIQEIDSQLSNFSGFVDSAEITITTGLNHQSDWADNWKQYYHPVRITKHLTIVPSWVSDYSASPGELMIYLDPGVSFGTGTHPTTMLSLLALELIMRGGEAVIDVGTGSGVLAIAASLLGADTVLATEIDAEAVTIAKTNIELNCVSADVEVVLSSTLDNYHQKADVIVANILAEVLLELIDDAVALLKPSGHLILSGIYHDKVDVIVAKVHQSGLNINTQMRQGDWHCLVTSR